MRKIIMAANWKMYKTLPEAVDFVGEFLPLIQDKNVVTVICPPSILIPAVVSSVGDAAVAVGAQNIYWEKEGAFTGEISAPMIASCGCTYCICGHSERRGYFGETNELVTHKAHAAINQGLIPIVCVGETLEERNNNETLEVLDSQVRGSLVGINPTQDIVIAYEPVWAIGTGVTAGVDDAQTAIKYIRSVLQEIWGDIAAEISILYGGSVKPENVAALMACADIDGALIGGASLKPSSFAEIINFQI